MAEMNDDELLAALGEEVTPLKSDGLTPREERIIAGFEDILRFHQTHGRAPQHGEGSDIFERLYAVRLEQLRKLPQAQTLLAAMDSHGLLSGAAAISADDLDEDALLAALGTGDGFIDEGDITVLRHVRSNIDKRAAAEEIADRKPCADFAHFKTLFEEAQAGLQSGAWLSQPFAKKDTGILENTFFILGGQLAYVAEVGEATKRIHIKEERDDPRLRVIFDNQTESNLRLRSFQKALWLDEASRRLIRRDDGPLFGDAAEPDDIACGTIYVLRSLSTHPFVAAHRELIHKIGVTGGTVEARIAGAARDTTYLLADVEVVASYQLHNVHRTKLESLLHRLFAAAQLDLSIEDRFGKPVKPREWFLVPLQVIDDAVQRIRDGSITKVIYDPKTDRLVNDFR